MLNNRKKSSMYEYNDIVFAFTQVTEGDISSEII